MKYYALTDPYTGVDNCGTVIRIGDGMPQRFENGAWVEDVELLGVYSGEIESTPITKQQAEEITKGLR